MSRARATCSAASGAPRSLGPSFHGGPLVLVQPFPLGSLKWLIPLALVVAPNMAIQTPVLMFNMTPAVLVLASVLAPVLVLWLRTARRSTACRVVLYAPPVAVSSGCV